MDKLLPCPLCGSNATCFKSETNENWDYIIDCDNCTLQLGGIGIDGKDLIKEWNTRYVKPTKTNKKFIKKEPCPDCGMPTDGSMHLDYNGDKCMTVMGRRGWRQLGEYDG